ncbi:MAG: outer membrane protein assembly factor BamD [Alphaproteobacteria bacterium]|nr:outer membrane protein assembly factor BamD [Alphaproteobacteria bacterium]
MKMTSRIVLVFMLMAVAACGSGGKKKFAYVERPAEGLYAEAVEDLERKRYDRAIPLFEEVERQHPYSPWARRAMLMKAFAYYRQNDYDEAIAALDQFISLHPGNKDAPYAYYLKAISFYEQIRDVGRDQDFTNKAVAALTDVVRRYPSTEYARDARLKLDLTFDHLAGKEMYVGRFYLNAGKYIAAVNRFNTVVEQYQTTSHVPEAMHRLVETYMQIGVIEEAWKIAAVLGYNYPGSEWYQYSYNLLDNAGVLEPGSAPKPSVLRKAKDEEKEQKIRRPVDLDTPQLSPVDSDIGNNSPIPPANQLPD